MKICMVSPAYRRFDVTDLALAQRRHLCDTLISQGIDATGVIVADDANLDIAKMYGFETVEHPNHLGLGIKFNAGFQHALDSGADYVIHIGSDDWMHEDFFSPLPIADYDDGWPDFVPGKVTIKRAGPVVLAAAGITCVNLLDSTGFTFNATRIWGTVPWAFPRSVLEGAKDWVEPEINRGVEHSLASGLYARHGAMNWQLCGEHPFLGIDWKSSLNVTPFHTLSHIGTMIEGDLFGQIEEFYPKHLVDKARALASALEVAV